MATTNETAVPPEIDLRKINEDVSSDIKVKEDNTGKEIASLKNHTGWIQVEEYINSRIKELEDFEIGALSVEEIGYRYAMIRGLRMELKTILNIVDSNYDYQKETKAKGE